MSASDTDSDVSEEVLPPTSWAEVAALESSSAWLPPAASLDDAMPTAVLAAPRMDEDVELELDPLGLHGADDGADGAAAAARWAAIANATARGINSKAATKGGPGPASRMRMLRRRSMGVGVGGAVGGGDGESLARLAVLAMAKAESDRADGGRRGNSAIPGSLADASFDPAACVARLAPRRARLTLSVPPACVVPHTPFKVFLTFFSFFFSFNSTSRRCTARRRTRS